MGSGMSKQQQEHSYHDDETSEDDSSSSPSSSPSNLQPGMPHDILTLDVGGEGTIRVPRHTLTQCKDSLLAAKFGRWKDEPQPDGTIYINQPMRLFKPLIDFLRDKENAPPGIVIFPPSDKSFTPGDEAIFPTFLRLVEHYGLMKYMYPFWVVTISPSARFKDCHLQPGGIHVKNQSGRAQYCYVKTTDPDYRIKSFQIEIQAASVEGQPLHGGFLHDDPPTDYLDPEEVKATKLSFPKVREGDILIFSLEGCKHFINDPALATIIETHHFDSPVQANEQPVIPFFGGNGAWSFAKVSSEEGTFECEEVQEVRVVDNDRESDDDNASETNSQAEWDEM